MGDGMFRIITLEREYGCGCAGIANALAHRLNWRLWDQSLTEEIAKQANVDCGTVEKRDVQGCLGGEIPIGQRVNIVNTFVQALK
jgi:hypothetical protein